MPSAESRRGRPSRFLDRRVRAAVEARRGGRPRARTTRSAGSTSPTSRRSALAARRRGVRRRRAARRGAAERSGSTRSTPRCWPSAPRPSCNPRYGRLYAYLQDDVTRKLAEPAARRPTCSRATGVDRADVLALLRRRRRALRAPRRAAAARRDGADAARRPAGQGRRPARRVPARRGRDWTSRARRRALRLRRSARCTTRAATRPWTRSRALLARRHARCRSWSRGPDAGR